MENDTIIGGGSAVEQSPKYRRAFEGLLAKAQAIPDEDLIRVTTDVPAAAAAVYHKKEALLELRPRVLAKLTAHDMATYDSMVDAAYGLRWAESQYQIAVMPTPEVGPLLADLDEKVAVVNADLQPMVARGQIPAVKAEAVKLGNGYRQKVSNALNTVGHVRNNWAHIVGGGTQLTLEQLDAIEVVAGQADELIGFADSQPARVAEATRVRNQFYTLFVLAYRNVAKAVNYLCDGKEAERYLPDIYADHGNRAPAQVGPVQPAVPATPAAPSPIPPAVSTPAVASDGEPVPLPMPSSNPFLR